MYAGPWSHWEGLGDWGGWGETLKAVVWCTGWGEVMCGVPARVPWWFCVVSFWAGVAAGPMMDSGGRIEAHPMMGEVHKHGRPCPGRDTKAWGQLPGL